MLTERIHALIEPTIKAMGLELWACELHQSGRHSLLRVLIDRDGRGASLDDCALISREIGAILDVEDPIKTQYQLEVSSPGMDRALSTMSHFERYIGSAVKVKLRTVVDDLRQFEAVVEKIEEECIFFRVTDKVVRVPLSDIQKCELKVIIK